MSAPTVEPQADPQPSPATSPEPNDGNDGGKVYTQEQYKRALARSSDDAKEKLKRDPEFLSEIRKAIEDEQRNALRAEQGEFKPLYEDAKVKIAELEAKASMVETLTAERDEALAVVAGLVDADLKAAPDYVQELIRDLPVTKQLAYLNQHRDKWTKGKPNGASPTPNPGNPLSPDELLRREIDAQRTKFRLRA